MDEVPLQKWISEQVVGDEMRWKGAWGDQVAFFRDKVARLFYAGLDYEDCDGIATVISTHRSKSIILPVYKLHRADIGLTMIFRENFYNWKMSVISEKPIIADFSGLFHTTPPLDPSYTGNPLADCYFEGFPGNLIFGYYEPSDKKKWSAEIWGDQALWTTVFLLLRSMDVIKAAEWHTRESHRKELDEQAARRKAREAARKET